MVNRSPFRNLVGQCQRLIQVREEILRGCRIDGELIVGHGERGILLGRLLEELPPVIARRFSASVRPLMYKSRASAELVVSEMTLVAPAVPDAVAPAVDALVALADSVPDFAGLQAVRVESRAVPASTAIDDANARGISSPPATFQMFRAELMRKGPMRAYGEGRDEFQPPVDRIRTVRSNSSTCWSTLRRRSTGRRGCWARYCRTMRRADSEVWPRRNAASHASRKKIRRWAWMKGSESRAGA